MSSFVFLMEEIQSDKHRFPDSNYLLIQATHFISLFSTLHYLGIEPVPGVANAMLYQLS